MRNDSEISIHRNLKTETVCNSFVLIYYHFQEREGGIKERFFSFTKHTVDLLCNRRSIVQVGVVWKLWWWCFFINFQNGLKRVIRYMWFHLTYVQLVVHTFSFSSFPSAYIIDSYERINSSSIWIWPENILWFDGPLVSWFSSFIDEFHFQPKLWVFCWSFLCIQEVWGLNSQINALKVSIKPARSCISMVNISCFGLSFFPNRSSFDRFFMLMLISLPLVLGSCLPFSI